MRKLLSAIVLLASSAALVHCAGSPASVADGKQNEPDNNVTEEKKDSGHSDNKPPPAETRDAAPPPPVVDAGPADAPRPPPPVDAAPPPPPDTPGPTCTALTACCGKLTNSVTAAACYVLSGKKNEYLCGGGFATFDCANAGGGGEIGPICAQLSACCNANQWIADDKPQCKGGLLGTPDWKAGNEDVCDNDLYYYQTDPYGDCL